MHDNIILATTIHKNDWILVLSTRIISPYIDWQEISDNLICPDPSQHLFFSLDFTPNFTAEGEGGKAVSAQKQEHSKHHPVLMMSQGAFFFLPEATAPCSLQEGPRIISLPFPYCIWFHGLCIYLAHPFEPPGVVGIPALRLSANEALTQQIPSPGVRGEVLWDRSSRRCLRCCSCTTWPWSCLMAGKDNQHPSCWHSHCRHSFHPTQMMPLADR